VLEVGELDERHVFPRFGDARAEEHLGGTPLPPLVEMRRLV
jgi:hypothetical protein